MTQAPLTLLAGADQPFAQEIAERLRAAGRAVTESPGYALDAALAQGAALDALVLVLPPPRLGTAFLDVDDALLEAELEQFLDVFGALNQALPRLQDGGGVVLVEARGHLGGWGGAHEMAFAGALAGLLRSVALENMARGVRANVIGVELPGGGSGQPASDPAEVADLAAFLLSPAAAAVNGELILANAGRSLQMREARDRRPARTPETPRLDRTPT